LKPVLHRYQRMTILILSLNDTYWELSMHTVVLIYIFSSHSLWNRNHLSPFYRWGNWGIGSSCNMFKVTMSGTQSV
jgi:hypothetical protein